MTVAELCEYLASNYDPEAPVQCLCNETDWVFDGESSAPVDELEWCLVDTGRITQLETGVIRIGENY